MRRKILPYNPQLKSVAKMLRKNMTFGEVLLWNQIKNKQMMGFDFDRQRPIDNYIVDFYCKDLMLAIEIDGSTHYSDQAYKKDIERQQKLESLGVRFLRFLDYEVRHEMHHVLKTIGNWIENNKHDYVGRIED